jgi:predicted component of type VI protein secretion system
MKQFFKPILLAVTATTGMLLSGCSSGLDPNTFTVELDVKIPVTGMPKINPLRY